MNIVLIFLLFIVSGAAAFLFGWFVLGPIVWFLVGPFFK